MSQSRGVNTCSTQRERGGQPTAEVLEYAVNFTTRVTHGLNAGPPLS